MTKNLNLEILTKNLVTFKRSDGVKDKKFQYYGVSLKNLIFKGGHKKPKYSGELPKRNGLREFADLRENLAKKRRDCVFEGGRGDTPMHTMNDF